MPANRVSASIGYTVNMGDFESMRFDFGLETDVMPEEKTREAMTRAEKFVEETLGAQVQKALARRN